MISILLLLFTSMEAKSIGSYSPSHQFCNKLSLTNGSCFATSSYCKDYKPTLEVTGSYSKIIYLDKRLTNFIVNQFNSIRNEFACGEALNLQNQKFPAAASMGLLEWNMELAWSARELSRTCMNSKVCPSTDSFLKAGQNIYMHQTFDEEDDVTELISKVVNKWKATKSFLDPEDVSGFGNHSNVLDVDLLDIGQIINEQAGHVGCSLNHCGMERDLRNYYFVCNFDQTVYVNQSLYSVRNRTCLADRKYKCLCDIPESKQSGGSGRVAPFIAIILCSFGVLVT